MLRTWAEVQVVECLPSIWKAMGSISTTVHTHIDAEIQHGSRPVTSDVESESELQTWTWTWPLDLNWTVAWIFQVLWPEFISGAWTWTWILGLLFRTWQWLDFGSGPWTWKWPWALILYLELRKAQKVDRHEPESWEESWILQLHHGHWLWFLTSNLNHVSQSWTWHWTGFFFSWYWGLKSGPCACKAKQSTALSPSSFADRYHAFVWVNFGPGSSYLCLPNSWD
jgi:hypothetical protein